MVESGIPQEVRVFLHARIHSIGEIEVLLLLHRDPSRWWTADEVNGELRTSLLAAQQSLSALGLAGLVEADPHTKSRFRFRTSDEATNRTVALLGDLFRDRLASIAEVIYAPRHDDIRAFADAFRLKKGSNDDGTA